MNDVMFIIVPKKDDKARMSPMNMSSWKYNKSDISSVGIPCSVETYIRYS